MSLKAFLKFCCKFMRIATIVYSIYLFFLVFGIMSFYSQSPMDKMLYEISIIAIGALGLMLVLKMGEFDLSVGAMANFGGFAFGIMVAQDLPVIIAFLIPTAICLLLGFAMGTVISRTKIASYIFTFAVSVIMISFIEDSKYHIILENAYITALLNNISGLGELFAALLFSGVWLLLKFTKVGRGFSVVPVLHGWLYKGMAFGLCASLAGFARMLQTANLGAAVYGTPDFILLRSFGAVLIGSIFSSKESTGVWETLYGAVIVTLLYLNGQLKNILDYDFFTLYSIPILFALLYHGLRFVLKKLETPDVQFVTSLETE